MKQILAFTLALIFVLMLVPFSAVAVGDYAPSGIATPDEVMISELYATENNIAFGKKYEISVTGAGYEQYTADLTDGVASHNVAAFDDAWFAFCCSPWGGYINAPDNVGTILLDLEQVYNIDNVKLHLANINSAAVSAPTSITFYLSNDGREYTLAEGLSHTILNDTINPEYDEMTYWAEFDLVDASARYILIEVSLKNYFVFINEIVVHQSEEAVMYNGQVADKFTSGKGTKKSPFIISNAAELAYMSEMVNNGDGKYYYQLANDIYLNDITVENWSNNAYEWSPIGTIENPFNGIFDGNGYSVYGLYINSNCDNVGLFGVVDSGEEALSGTTISNLSVKASYVKGRSNVGAVVGKVYDVVSMTEESITFENCYTDAIVEGEFNVGGIVGYASESTFYECVNDGVVSGVCNVAGICGNAMSPIALMCENNGDIYGGDNVGGIFGVANSAIAMEVYNSGKIAGNALVGGILGNGNAAMMMSAVNDGDVMGCYFVGGMFGYLNNGYLDVGENNGQVEAIAWVGGISGRSHFSDYYDVDNNGDIYGKDYVGGIIGGGVVTMTSVGSGMTYGEITNVENNGDIYGNCYVGGIMGEAIGIDVEFACNNGDVQRYSYEGIAKLFGGIFGVSYDSSVLNSYNAGDLFGGNFVGGISGNTHNDVIKYCYNSGFINGDASEDISGFTYCGAIIGVYDEDFDSEVAYCYYLKRSADLGIAGGWNNWEQRYPYNNDIFNIVCLTDEEMREESSFLGFSFEYIWEMDIYPVLTGDHDHVYEYYSDEEYHYCGCECGDVLFAGEHVFSPWEDYGEGYLERYCVTCWEYMGERECLDDDRIISIGKDYMVTNNGKYYPYTANLTDGVATDYIYSFDNQWFAIQYNHETGENTNTVNGVGSIIIDLEDKACIENVAVNFANIYSCAVNPPEWVKVYSSVDGKTFNLLGEMDICRYDEEGYNEEISYWSYLDIDNVDARYIKVEIKVDAFFVFLNEISVYGEFYEKVVEPEEKPDSSDKPSNEDKPSNTDKPSNPEKPEEKIMIGDVNGNEKIDMTDYILVKRAYFGTFNFNEAQNKAGDINKNGKIDMTDYILVKRAYFGTYTIK